MRFRIILTLVGFTTLAAGTASRADEAMLRKSVTLYASFDKEVKADRGGGVLTVSTRSNNPAKKGGFSITPGVNDKVFRIAPDKGISGAALEVVDTLPANGRIFFPAAGNIGYKKGGWGGAISCWINTNPNEMLKTPFCDPVQITQKNALDGGIWFDFNNVKPRRDIRMGVFAAVPPGQKPIAEEAPNAPIAKVPGLDLKKGDWHHIVLNWENLDTGKADAKSTFYIDGKVKGTIADRPLAMNWDIDKTGIYVAVSYIGLLDEFAVFGRTLTPEEVQLLHTKPGVLADK